MSKTPMGALWKESGYDPLYQHYRRVEDVARDVEKRRRRGWVATKEYINEAPRPERQFSARATEHEPRGTLQPYFFGRDSGGTIPADR